VGPRSTARPMNKMRDHLSHRRADSPLRKKASRGAARRMDLSRGREPHLPRPRPVVDLWRFHVYARRKPLETTGQGEDRAAHAALIWTRSTGASGISTISRENIISSGAIHLVRQVNARPGERVIEIPAAAPRASHSESPRSIRAQKLFGLDASAEMLRTHIEAIARVRSRRGSR